MWQILSWAFFAVAFLGLLGAAFEVWGAITLGFTRRKAQKAALDRAFNRHVGQAPTLRVLQGGSEGPKSTPSDRQNRRF